MYGYLRSSLPFLPCRPLRPAFLRTGCRRLALTLTALLLLLATLTLSPAAHAKSFDFDDVVKRARVLAQKPYKKADDKLPAALQNLNMQKYREIRMKGEHTLWRGSKNMFEVELLPPGDVFGTPVKVNEVTVKGARELPFDGSLFDYGESGIDARAMQQAKLGFSGLRVRLQNGKGLEEVLQLQGGSYIRAHAKGKPYGAFSRGLAIDTALNSGERFPQFVEFWLAQPAATDKELTLYALLDSPHMSGAYRFVLRPAGDTTIIDVKSQLYLRKSPEKIGIAPLTSMFHFGENQQRPLDDYRPEVHNSDGLAIQGSDGEWIWRPLSSPKRLLITSFSQKDPLGFGLLQRDRHFGNYEDIGMRYDQRPNLWVEPKGKWGDGRIELVQIPSPSEWNDNIVAFWVPDSLSPLKQAGQPVLFEYRLTWSRDSRRPPTAWVTQTRWGQAVRGKSDNIVSLHIDFEGPALKPFDAANPLEGVSSCDSNGKIIASRAYVNEATGGWRLELQIQRNDPTKPIEMRAALRKDTTTLSETWSYILPPAN